MVNRNETRVSGSDSYALLLLLGVPEQGRHVEDLADEDEEHGYEEHEEEDDKPPRVA